MTINRWKVDGVEYEFDPENPPEGCTCHLEEAFSVVDDTDIAKPGEPPFSVIDAECEVVARCSRLAYADLVCKALNDLGDAKRQMPRADGNYPCSVPGHGVIPDESWSE